MTHPRFSFRPACFAVAMCFAGAAGANPAGLGVAAGQATLQSVGKTLNIRNSNGAILNWKSFSIARDETTRFIQPNAASSVLNRIVGEDPSRILGALQSNGRVFLINPNGIMFGEGARVDVAGLIASTLNISDRDFRAGRLNFSGAPSAGTLSNAGSIVTPRGGRIYLIAPQIENSGVIRSPGGEIVLAAGSSVQLVDAGSPDLRVEVSAPASGALKLGAIIAAGERDGIYAGLIRQQGRVSADAAQLDAAGRVVFKASHATVLGAGSTTSASGGRGGSIRIDSVAGDTLVSGSVAATGSRGQGGAVSLLGERVGLLASASVDASGSGGGGRILVGGDFQGRNTAVHNASATTVAADVQLHADAGGKGDGGSIIVWSDGTTQAGGELSARGGADGGNGGLIEVSAKGRLDYTAHADLRAPKGAAGTLLLDPANVLVTDDSGSALLAAGAGFDGFGLFTGGTAASVLTWTEIDAALSDGNVIITTSGSETGALGNITLAAPVNSGVVTLASGNDLSFLAHNDISLDALQLQRNSNGAIRMVAGWDGNVATPGVTGSTGSIVFRPSPTLGSSITSKVSPIELRAAGNIFKDSGQSGGIFSAGGSVQIDAKGFIGLSGTAIDTTPDGFAATHGGAISLLSGSGGISIGAVSSAGATFTGGGGNGGAVRIISRDGAISLIGNINARGADAFDGSGGSGGNIEVAVGGDSQSPALRTTSAPSAITSFGSLDASGGTGSDGSFISPIGSGGSGGNILIRTDLASAGGDIVLPNPVSSNGSAGGSDTINLLDGASGGNAGSIVVRAGAGSDVSFSRLFANGGDGGAGVNAGLSRQGGTVTLSAGRDIINDGSHFLAGIFADGGNGGGITNGSATAGAGATGGTITLTAGRDIRLATGGDGGALSADGGFGGSSNGAGGNGGSGGQIGLGAVREQALDATLLARGGSGGSGSSIGSRGAGGTVRLEFQAAGGSGTLRAVPNGSSGGLEIVTFGGGTGSSGSVEFVSVGGDLVVDADLLGQEASLPTIRVPFTPTLMLKAGRDITLKAPISAGNDITVSARDPGASPPGANGKIILDRSSTAFRHDLPLLESDGGVITLSAPSGSIASTTRFDEAVSDLFSPGGSLVLDARDGIGGQFGTAAPFNNPIFVDDWVDLGQLASLHFRNSGSGDVWIASHRPLDVDEGLAANGNIRLESKPNAGSLPFSSASSSEINLARAGGTLLGLGGDVKAPNGSVTYVADQLRQTGTGAFGKTLAGSFVEVIPFTGGTAVSVDTGSDSSALLRATEIASFSAPLLIVGDFADTPTLTLRDISASVTPLALNRPATLGGIELRSAGGIAINAPLLFAGGDVTATSTGGLLSVAANAPISANNITLDAGSIGTVTLAGALNAAASITLAGDTLTGASGLTTPGALNIATTGGITLTGSVGSFSASNSGGGTLSFTDLDGFEVGGGGISNPGGAITLDAGTGALTQALAALISGSSLSASAADINLSDANQVGSFSGTATSIVSFANAGDLTVNAVSAPAVALSAGSGILNVVGPISAVDEIALAGGSVVGASGLNTASLLVDTINGFSGSGSVDRLRIDNTGSGAVSFTNSKELTLTGVRNSGNGSIALTTTAGDLINDPGPEGSTHGIVSGGGAVTLSAAASFSNVGGINSGGGAISISTGGSLTNNAPGISSGGGNISLTAVGDISTMLIDAGSGNVRLASSAGAILDIDAGVADANGNVPPTVIGASLELSAFTGIGTPLVALDTRSAELSATTQSGGINIANVLPEAAASFRLRGASAASGDVRVSNVGAMQTTAAVRAEAGSLGLLAQSPLTIGAPVFASGNIVLRAGSRSSPTDLLAINGSVTSNTGNISLDAADGITQGAAVATGGGNVDVNTGGAFAMTPTATIVSGNGPIRIAAVGDVSLGLIDGGSGSVLVGSESGSIGSADPALTNNIRAGTLTMNANTGIRVNYSARALQVNNKTGFIVLRNAETGDLLTDDPALLPPPAPPAEEAPSGESTPELISNSINSTNASIDDATGNVLVDGEEEQGGPDAEDKKKKKADEQSQDESDKDKKQGDKQGVGVCNA